MSLLTLKTPLRIVPAMPQRPPQANIPQTLAEREHLRAIVVRYVEERRETLVPPLVLDELRDQADARGRAGRRRSGLPRLRRRAHQQRSVVASSWPSVPFDRRLLLLPKCLRVEDKCPAPFDEFGLLCKQCGLCTIQDLQEEAERLGYAVLVAEGSALVMALIQSGKIDAIVGVSCLSVLETRVPLHGGGGHSRRGDSAAAGRLQGHHRRHRLGLERHPPHQRRSHAPARSRRASQQRWRRGSRRRLSTPCSARPTARPIASPGAGWRPRASGGGRF